MSTPFILPEPFKVTENAVLSGVLKSQPVIPRLEVFVSHATRDAEHVALVRQQIEALGISGFREKWNRKLR